MDEIDTEIIEKDTIWPERETYDEDEDMDFQPDRSKGHLNHRQNNKHIPHKKQNIIQGFRYKL